MRRIDLNLFRVFESVMRHRSIVGASRDLRITPSAVSHALTRLRATLEDPLFVASEGGMEPTARALELAPRIREGLAHIDQAIFPARFVPALARRTFRIAMSEYSASTLLPGLVKTVREQAPGIDIRIFPFSRTDTMRHLDDARIDLVVGWFTDLPERLRRRRLWEDRETIVVRNGHPLAGCRVTQEDLLRFPHVVIELTGSGEHHDSGFLVERGASRRVWIERVLLGGCEDGGAAQGRVAVSIPHYAVVVPILAGSDLVATLPASYAAPHIRAGDIVALELPFEPVTGHLDAIWHQRSDDDEALQWLVSAAASVPGANA
ncbi:LysR family transcriptional regulator [Pseudoxanthomonas putridarboris]|uniref:LysR family transcriptional regulator n=2 Tax=Pseudoxanthomonas putridarboris TaxID=752605 RepID=A0ABU9J1S1_9GAMM